ncbi:hypothetical protein DEU56DRAFT_915419 [Suillus clintonianus]|uniref:uncharacterized protein n=1 Tax=Suillus clintonianus TaxID=1904413 RepID=UPI001B85E2F6|nr:uncharacterized protein DEU56DRAFT_915419 [Suillus clintonianus]KAG2128746.1 hypothetical protein DEU56DRAFT_915419 [Suillus clintonianus]
MEVPSSPSSIITAPPDYRESARRLAKLVTEAMTCDFALLHYDKISRSMIEWCWPNDDEGKKVLPSNFKKYREEHDFLYPCCLCAEEGGRGAYTEAAVYSWRDKTTDNTCWKARCASDRCGYRVKIDAYYHRSSVGTCQYPRREQHKEPRPIHLEWTYQEQKELMKNLESAGDGITANEFHTLFRRCKQSLRPIEVPTADYVSISATPRCAVTPPIVVHSAAAAAYSAAAQQKCESWLRRQHTDLTPSNEFFSIESDLPPNALAAGQLAHAPEQRTSVFVNCNPSFRLCSTWVTLCVHEAFDEARKVELSTEAGLMATYLDIERYYSHHRNAKSELLYLRAKMLRAKAEVEVFALAIENASSPHSTYFQSVLPEQPSATQNLTTSLASLVVLIITLALQVINLCCINISVPPTTLVASTEFAQLYLAFEGVGVDDEDVFTLATIKGMYSRLYTHPESVSALRTMENGIDRDHLRTLVTSHHTCNSPSHLDCDSLNHPHHPSPTNNAHLAMKAAAYSQPSRDYFSVPESLEPRHGGNVGRLHHLLGLPLKLDLHMDTTLLLKEGRVTALQVIITIGLRQKVNQQSHSYTPDHAAAHGESFNLPRYQPQPPSEFDEEAYGSGHDDKPMANDDIGTAAAIEALKITAANNQEDHRMDSKLTRTLRMQGHLPDHKHTRPSANISSGVSSPMLPAKEATPPAQMLPPPNQSNQLKSSLVMALESRAVEVKVKDLCRKLPVHSRKTPVTEMTTTYDK